MKKFMKSSFSATLLVLAITFTSCQDEFEELTTDEETETIASTSAAATLIKNTSSQDGSFDNIVDGISCFAIEFPYTVNVNGLEVTINSKEDLATVENILDQVDIDDDILEIIFPITITLADFSELVISSKDALREKAKECIEGGKDDDIECIDFVYPMTVYSFDLNKEQTGNETVESDRQLRRFFGNLKDNQLVSIDFPISLKLYDGSEIEVYTNAELASAIEGAKEACDEDDDNDHNDDDFSKERLDAYLVACPWLIYEVYRNSQDQTDQYFQYAMNFSEDGSVVVKDREGNAIEGTWATTRGEQRVIIELEFAELVDFSLEWSIYELEPGKIKLYAGDGNKIIMKKACDILNADPATLREVLKECSWVIKKVVVDNEEVRRLLGYEFNFLPEGVVTLSNGDTTSTGSWVIALNDQGRLVMSITMGDEPGVSFDWPLSDFRRDRLKFEIPGTDYELILQRVCNNNDDDGDVAEIRNKLIDGTWAIASYMQGDEDKTVNFTEYTFNFDAFHLLGVSQNQDPIGNGLWKVLRNHDQHLKVYLNLGEDNELSDLTDVWKFISIDEGRLEIKDYGDDGVLTKLVFEKL